MEIIMKKILTAFAVLALSTSLMTGCGSKNIDADAVSQGILNGVQFAEQLSQTSDKISLKRLGLNADDVESCTAYTSTNAVVDEFAVIKATNPDNVETAINTHIANQKATYESYAPNEVTKLDNAVVEKVGDYVIYVVSTDGTSAKSVVDSLIK